MRIAMLALAMTLVAVPVTFAEGSAFAQGSSTTGSSLSPSMSQGARMASDESTATQTTGKKARKKNKKQKTQNSGDAGNSASGSSGTSPQAPPK